MDKADSKVGYRLPVVPRVAQPQVFSQYNKLVIEQNGKTNAQLEEENESLARSLTQMKHTPKNARLLDQLQGRYNINKFILERRGVKK